MGVRTLNLSKKRRPSTQSSSSTEEVVNQTKTKPKTRTMEYMNMKTKKSLNPQIVAPVERTTATSRNNNAGSPAGVDAQDWELRPLHPFFRG